MSLAIEKIYKTNSLEGIHNSILKSLEKQNLLSSNRVLTDIGKRYAILNLPLNQQCSALSIPYETIDISYNKKPEPIVLQHYQKLGYLGICSEGIGILTILKALMLDKLIEYNIFKDRDDACNRYLEAQFTTLQDRLNEIILSISSISKNQYLKNFKEIISQPYIALSYPDLSTAFASAMYDAIDTNIFIKIAKQFAEDPYTYRKGWPDLTLVKDKEVLFIEIKTNDKLHESQLITIPIMSKILPFRFSICKINNS